MEPPAFDSLDGLERYLKTAALEALPDACRARGVTQKRWAEMFRLPPNFLTVVKSSERKGHYFNFAGACKIAGLYVLEMDEQAARRQETHTA